MRSVDIYDHRSALFIVVDLITMNLYMGKTSYTNVPNMLLTYELDFWRIYSILLMTLDVKNLGMTM